MLWQAADATGCRCSEIDLVNMWKSSVGGLGEHEMGVMRTKGRARFVTHLGDKDSVDEEFLAREFGNFLEERMGVRLEEGDEMHTNGFLKSLGHAVANGVSGMRKAIAPTKEEKAKDAFMKAGKKQLEAEVNEKVALSKLEDNINDVEKNRQAIAAAENKKNKAFKKPDSEE
jgi:hypothetical protein